MPSLFISTLLGFGLRKLHWNKERKLYENSDKLVDGIVPLFNSLNLYSIEQ